MAGLVTKETDKSVMDFINSIENESKRTDSKVLLALIEEVTGYEPKIWGNNFIIGFGKYSYTRKNSKEELEWFHVGFAPRKTKLTIYLTFNLKAHTQLLEKMGKCKWGSGCLYVNKLSDINLDVLKELISLGKKSQWK